MSYVASLALCKALYEVSGWSGEKGCSTSQVWTNEKFIYVPYYGLGYLLRKLPYTLPKPDHRWKYQLYRQLTCLERPSNVDHDTWAMSYKSLYRIAYIAHADTPEDAACKLAIELFKSGILKKEQE